MGDTGSELSGLLILILAGFALLWFAGNKLIDKIEARRKKAETTTVTAGSISSIKAKKSFKLRNCIKYSQS
ncbi:MAG TPA: hypothetical protein VH186_01690 [Chloroflexia bacterium]|nr:hypothetical protein [Chloroflexia bacterium]